MDNTTLIPLGSRIHIKKIKVEDGINAGGIFVMNKNTRDDRFTVIAVGHKCVEPIMPGDVVYVAPTSPISRTQDDGSFVDESWVYAKEA